MKSKKFLKLHKGTEICMDDKIYKVLDIDHMGRVQLQQIVYYIDDRKVRDEEFDSFDDCMDLLKDMRDEDIDCDLTSNDIHERTTGNKFWMHYKDIDGFQTTL